MKRALHIIRKSFLILFGFYFLLGGGLRDMYMGRLHSSVENVFRDTDGITEVRILLLDGAPGSPTKDSYRVATWDHDVPVYGSVSVTGTELETFMNLWRYQLPHVSLSALCFSPPYAFKLYRGSKLVTETAICWHCCRLTVTPIPFMPMTCGYDANSIPSQKLLEFCDRLLPYYRSPTEEKKTE